MQLLLFLSALLTCFTGIISGDRVAERVQVQRTASGTAVAAFAETVAPAPRATHHLIGSIAVFPAVLPLVPVQAGALRTVLSVSGRRLQ